jgi:hypothetical protein
MPLKQKKEEINLIIISRRWFFMTKYHRIDLPKTSGVYLTDSEMLKMLMQHKDIYRLGLERGKAFKRANSLRARIEQKRSEAQE